MAWLPFLGFIRRSLDPGGLPGADPFLLVVPIVTSVLVVGAIWGGRERLGASLSQSRATLLVSLLVAALVLAVFNPTQGSLFVGLSGTIFLFFPVLWFFLGRVYLDDKMVTRLLWITVWTGFICALYGGYQAFVGFLPSEEHWIKSRDFASLQVGRFIRPFSTFPSPEEWSRYTVVATTAAIGLSSCGGAPAMVAHSRDRIRHRRNVPVRGSNLRVRFHRLDRRLVHDDRTVSRESRVRDAQPWYRTAGICLGGAAALGRGGARLGCRMERLLRSRVEGSSSTPWVRTPCGRVRRSGRTSSPRCCHIIRSGWDWVSPRWGPGGSTPKVECRDRELRGRPYSWRQGSSAEASCSPCSGWC